MPKPSDHPSEDFTEHRDERDYKEERNCTAQFLRIDAHAASAEHPASPFYVIAGVNGCMPSKASCMSSNRLEFPCSSQNHVEPIRHPHGQLSSRWVGLESPIGEPEIGIE